MLILYNVNHNKIAALKNVKDPKNERTLNGDEVLSFLYPISDSKYPLIQEECYVRTKDNEYVIKEINEGEDWTELVAKVNVESLKGKEVEHFETVEETCINAANLALAGTGWTIGSCDVTKKRTVRKQRCSSFDVLQEIRNVYRCDFKFDAINKKIFIYQFQGIDKGTYFTDQLNLKKLDVQRNSYDYITRIIPYGKDGITIESVNNGVKYVENFQYSNKVITAYWEDNRYTVVQNLKDDAMLRLNELSNPRRAYKADIIDLAKNTDGKYSALDYDLGDTITLVDNVKKIKDKQRIVKIIEYLDDPERNQIEIANRIMSLEDLQVRLEDSADTVENITTSDGMIDNSKVDFDPIRLEVVSLISQKADIGDLNTTNARIGNLETTSATITQLNAAIARINTLEVNSATITQLNTTNARIDNLSSIYATTVNLNAANARIEALEATSATITQLDAATARITILEVNSATIEDLTVINARIDNLTVDTAHIVDLAVTNAKIANATITGAKIANASIDTANIKLGAITSALIEVGAIGTAQIANGSITDAKIVELTANKINAGTLSVERLVITGSNQSIVFKINEVNGTAQLSQSTIDGGALTQRSITADRIVAKAITANEIAGRTITSNEIVAGTITGNEIKAATITGSNIAANTITANNLQAGTITAASGIIASIDASKITTGSLSADRISGGSLTLGGNIVNITAAGITVKDIKAFIMRSSDSNYLFQVDNYINNEPTLYTKNLHARFESYYLPTPQESENHSFIEFNGGSIDISTYSTGNATMRGRLLMGAGRQGFPNSYIQALNEIDISGTKINLNGNINLNGTITSNLNVGGIIDDMHWLGTVGTGTANNWYRIATFTAQGQYNNFNIWLEIAGRGEVRAKVYIAGEYGVSAWNTPGLYVYSWGSLGGQFRIVCDNANKKTYLYYHRTNDWNLENFKVSSKWFEGVTMAIENTNIGSAAPTINYSYTAPTWAMVIQDQNGYISTGGQINCGWSIQDDSYQNRLYGKSNNDIIYVGTQTCKMDTVAGTFRVHQGTNYLAVKSNGWDFTSGSYTGAYITTSGGIYGASKSALTNTENYGEVITYADESPNHVFNDAGHGILDENGECYIFLDPIFLETVSTNDRDYIVTIGSYYGASAEICDKQPDYFVIKGNPNKEFDWIIRAERKGMERLRWNDADLLI